MTLGAGSIGQLAIGQASSGSGVTDISAAQFLIGLSEPVRQKIAPALAIALAASSGNSFSPLPIPPANPFGDKFWNRFAEPVRTKPGLAPALQQSLALVQASPFQETIYESKFHFGWSEPSVKAKASLLAGSQQFLALVKATPFAETTSYDKYAFPFSEPVRIKPGLLASEQLSASWIFAETPQIDKWLYQLSEPVRIKPGLAAANQAAYPALAEASPFAEAVTESRWHQAWSEPVRIKPRLLAGTQPSLTFTYFPPPPIDRFLLAWSEPVRKKPGLRSDEQQSLGFDEPSPITEMGWLYAYSTPVRVKPGLHASNQPYPASLVIVPIFANPRLMMKNIIVRVRIIGPKKSTITS